MTYTDKRIFKSNYVESLSWTVTKGEIIMLTSCGR